MRAIALLTTRLGNLPKQTCGCIQTRLQTPSLLLSQVDKGTAYECVGKNVFCGLEPQHKGHDQSFSYHIWCANFYLRQARIVSTHYLPILEEGAPLGLKCLLLSYFRVGDKPEVVCSGSP